MSRSGGAAVAAVLPLPVAVDRQVRALLARSDAELVAADLAPSAGERFVHGHLAALRAAAAVVAARGRPARAKPRPVWELLADAAPELTGWAQLFAGAAPLRAAAETGRVLLDEARADAAVADATAFAAVVRSVLSVPPAGEPAPPFEAVRWAS